MPAQTRGQGIGRGEERNWCVLVFSSRGAPLFIGGGSRSNLPPKKISQKRRQKIAEESIRSISRDRARAAGLGWSSRRPASGPTGWLAAWPAACCGPAGGQPARGLWRGGPIQRTRSISSVPPPPSPRPERVHHGTSDTENLLHHTAETRRHRRGRCKRLRHRAPPASLNSKNNAPMGDNDAARHHRPIREPRI